MAQITTKITQVPKVVGRFDTEFIETADKFLNQLPNTYTQLNSFAGETNKVRDEVNDLRDAAKSYRDEAYNKAEEAKAVVIPDEATYSKDEIELRSLTMGQAQFEALAEERRKKYAGSGVVDWGRINATDSFKTLNGSSHNISGENNFLISAFNTKDWAYQKMGMGNIDLTKFSINGNLITYTKANWSLPNSPTAFTVTDSTKLPQAMTQGDFAILKDLDRELVTNGTFDSNINGWDEYSENVGSITYDSTNNRIAITTDSNVNFQEFAYQKISVIPGVRYKISADVTVGSHSGYLHIRDGAFGANIKNLEITSDGNYSYEFTFDKDYVFVCLEGNVENSKNTVYFDNISIKQAEEQPIVALTDVTSDTDVYANTDKFEARDSVSRQDLVFLESWEEKISEKDIIYPFGNIAYRGSDVDGLTGIAEGTFEGADTYSRFGVWQSAGDLVGKGYIWSKLTLEEKKSLVSNPEHNIYVDENGDFIQVRYRVRVVKGIKNGVEGISPLNNSYSKLMYEYNNSASRIQPKGKLTNIPFDISDRLLKTDYGKTSEFGTTTSNNAVTYFNDDNDLGLFGIHSEINPSVFGENGLDFALPITLVQRRNQGIYHPIHNPEGTALLAYDPDGNGLQMLKWYEVPDSANNSLQDCFDPSKIAIYKLDDNGNITVSTLDQQDGTYLQTGLIESKVSGRPDGIYADEVNERDVEDLRMSAHKKPFKEILDEMVTKAIIGEIRGKEDTPFIKPETNPNDLFKRWCKDDGSLEDQFIEKSFTYNNVITWTDIIGDPRKLQDRIQYTVGDDDTIAIPKNMYVLCNDSSNNSGTKGHLYRWLKDPIPDSNKIHTNSTDGDANVGGGHIDFSKTDAWLDLGTDLTIGAYNQVWLQKGFNGTPLILGENGESLLPIDIGLNNGSGDDGQSYKLSKKNINGLKLFVSKKSGEFVEYTYQGGDGDHKKLGYNSAFVNGNSNNTLVFNIDSSYNDLGYGSVQEMLDLMKVIVTYETKANNMEIADNSEVIELNKMVYAGNHYGNNDGIFVFQNLLNKIPTGDYLSLYFRSGRFELTSFGMRPNNTFDSSGYYGIFKDNIIDNFANTSSVVKYFAYLTQQNNRAYLQYVFKELKYDSSSNTWGDDNKFQIVDKVSTVTDTNGNTVLVGQKRIPLNYFIPEEN